uniref:Pre-mRNA-splicing factor n=1 Tax=Bursaphelenchus xylophilus TaxID=6326 RepID=A0A1I7RNL0_BURXY
MARTRSGRKSTETASVPKASPSSSSRNKVKKPKIDVSKGLNLDEWSRNQWNYEFNSSVVEQIYVELILSSFNVKVVNKLEFSQYLEEYLWPHLDVEKSSKAHILSIVVLINAKFRERVNAWKCIVEASENFSGFFRRVLEYSLQNSLPFLEQNTLITFISHCVNSLEVDCVRNEAVKLASLACWQCLGKKYREKLLGSSPKLRKYWNKLTRAFESMPEEKKSENDFYATVIWKLIKQFKLIITELDDENITFDPDAAMYCEKFALLLIDLECQLTTRRFLHALIIYSQCIIHATNSQFYLSEPGTLFFKLMRLFLFYAKFEVENLSGYPLSLAEIQKNHYDFVNKLQVVAFRYFKEKSSDFALLNVGNVDNRVFLEKVLKKYTKDELYKMAYEMDLIGSPEENEDERLNDAIYLREIIIFHTVRPISQLDKINSQPLYPNEQVIWDENLVPYDEYNGESVLPLNRLNLQFLTLHDYLLRNFNLFQMESTYEIRSDLEDALFRMRPYKHEMLDNVVWGGWARMGIPVTTTRIVHVGKPFVGQDCPSEVKADVTVNLPKRTDLRKEWEGMRRNDVLFLVTVVPIAPLGTRYDIRKPFKEQFRIETVRGCEVEGILNNDKEVIDEQNMQLLRSLHGDSRTFRVRLDPNQYKADTDKTEIYFKFNLMIRRDAKSNNFKAVLATIRQLLNTECVVPDWIHDVLLGYGEPDAANYKKLPNSVTTLNFNDTFLDMDHLKKSFEGEELKIAEGVTQPPFKLTFNELNPQHDKEHPDTSIFVEAEAVDPVQKELKIETRKNSVPFTPAQVEAIKSGMEPGLTMVVGPPGTGKTDVAVQIISNIYHNWPEERTLIVTHSNQALNQLFEKIMALDIDERHLLRLGHGEEELETTKDFSRGGRVNYVLNERIQLLKQVARLRLSLNEPGEVESSCENAGYFFRYTVTRTWENFLEEVEGVTEKTNDFVKNKFPFTKYFVEGERELFKAESFDEDLEKANACWEFIRRIFSKLDEFRAFELLRNGKIEFR